jgi:hypothetical protein
MMGCTPDEATMLGGEMLRHRAGSAAGDAPAAGSSTPPSDLD